MKTKFLLGTFIVLFAMVAFSTTGYSQYGVDRDIDADGGVSYEKDGIDNDLGNDEEGDSSRGETDESIPNGDDWEELQEGSDNDLGSDGWENLQLPDKSSNSETVEE